MKMKPQRLRSSMIEYRIRLTEILRRVPCPQSSVPGNPATTFAEPRKNQRIPSEVFEENIQQGRDQQE